MKPREEPGTPLGRRLLSLAVFVVAGFMIATGAVNARGGDLRPNRNTDLAGLIASESKRNAELAERVAVLRRDVDRLARDDGGRVPEERLRAAAEVAGQRAVRGPAVVVVLDDVRSAVRPAGVSPELLVVHQQDIQAVVNALWAGGAEAMTIQGQRVISTTGIKCVGNTVVLHGVPYAPPYVIEAIGDADALLAGLNDSPSVQIYKQYVDVYGLGYAVDRVDSIEAPAFSGSVGLRFATPVQGQ